MLPVLSSCGYHLFSHVDALPKDIRTIAIPAFENLTPRYPLSERLPGELSREFISRTRYRVVADQNDADAILRGTVTNYLASPTASDDSTGITRASAVQISVFLQLTLTERQTGKVLFTRPSMEVRQRYEISRDQGPYLDESDVELRRVSREVAKTVVSAILEAF